eukprot:15449588-Alexandrium_andersonii.AAC.1
MSSAVLCHASAAPLPRTPAYEFSGIHRCIQPRICAKRAFDHVLNIVGKIMMPLYANGSSPGVAVLARYAHLAERRPDGH